MKSALECVELEVFMLSRDASFQVLLYLEVIVLDTRQRMVFSNGKAPG